MISSCKRMNNYTFTKYFSKNNFCIQANLNSSLLIFYWFTNINILPHYLVARVVIIKKTQLYWLIIQWYIFDISLCKNIFWSICQSFNGHVMRAVDNFQRFQCSINIFDNSRWRSQSHFHPIPYHIGTFQYITTWSDSLPLVTFHIDTFTLKYIQFFFLSIWFVNSHQVS